MTFRLLTRQKAEDLIFQMLYSLIQGILIYNYEPNINIIIMTNKFNVKVIEKAL